MSTTELAMKPSFSVVGANVTVNNDDANQSVRRAIVTPISNPANTQAQPAVSAYHIEKVLLKAVCKGAKKTKKEPKTFRSGY